MRAQQAIKSMIRKRLIALGRYKEKDVQRVYDVLTERGTRLENAVITVRAEVLDILDQRIKEILGDSV